MAAETVSSDALLNQEQKYLVCLSGRLEDDLVIYQRALEFLDKQVDHLFFMVVFDCRMPSYGFLYPSVKPPDLDRRREIALAYLHRFAELAVGHDGVKNVTRILGRNGEVHPADIIDAAAIRRGIDVILIGHRKVEGMILLDQKGYSTCDEVKKVSKCRVIEVPIMYEADESILPLHVRMKKFAQSMPARVKNLPSTIKDAVLSIGPLIEDQMESRIDRDLPEEPSAAELVVSKTRSSTEMERTDTDTDAKSHASASETMSISSSSDTPMLPADHEVETTSLSPKDAATSGPSEMA